MLHLLLMLLLLIHTTYSYSVLVAVTEHGSMHDEQALMSTDDNYSKLYTRHKVWEAVIYSYIWERTNVLSAVLLVGAGRHICVGK